MLCWTRRLGGEDVLPPGPTLTPTFTYPRAPGNRGIAWAGVASDAPHIRMGGLAARAPPPLPSLLLRSPLSCACHSQQRASG